MKKQIPAWMALGIIMLVAAFSLAGTNMITEGIIADQAVVNAENARKAVLSDADVFEMVEVDPAAPVSSLYIGKNGEEAAGYVGSTTVQGYGGPIEIIAGVREDGTITGINVGGSAFAETAGLGSKAKDASFIDQFAGKQSPIKVVVEGEPKDNTTVDAITAATITTKAVVRGVNDIAKFVDGYLHPIGDLSGGFTAGTAKGEADGFAGPVAVEVTFDADAKIEKIVIGDDNFAETPGYGATALEPAFAERFVGKQAPLQLGDIEAISGATVTSTAVVDAINHAMQQLAAPAAQFSAGTAASSAEGFAGPVAVEVTFDGDAKIESITIGDDQFAETAGYGAAALEPAFAEQFVGKQAPLQLSDIEAISGATVTSTAVVDAINAAYQQLLSSEPAEAVKEVVEAVEPTEVPAPVEGAVTVSKEGFAGPVAVTVSFEEDGATIKTLAIGDDQFAETPGFGAAAKDAAFIDQFIGKKAPLAIGDIEAISGATITTEAVLEAINEAQGGTVEAQPAEEVKEEEPAVAEGAVTVSKEGFAGPVAVTVSFEEDGATIKTLAIGDDQFAETPGFGEAAKDAAFIDQFIGKKAPLAIGDIEAISGATITTEAVLEAINEAQGGKVEEQPAEEVKEEEPAAVEGAVTVSKEGFAGPVAVTVSFEEDGATIKTLAIGDDQFAETPGFGEAAKDAAFIDQFIGKKAPLAIGDIEAISGATITTEAVLEAINEAQGGTVEEQPAEEVKEEEPAVVEGAVTVSKEGFAGPVAVTVSFEEDGATIKTLAIGDDQFAETPGFGEAAKDAAFIDQFIGKKAPLVIGDIEAISGATITTEAVLEAINEAQGGKVEEQPAEEVKEEEPAVVEGAVTVSKEGFAGPVAVTVSFEEDGATIKTLAIGDDQFAETPGFGEAAKDAAFIDQFIGKKAPLAIGDIEAISGATITTEAVLEAITEAQTAGATGTDEEPSTGEARSVSASAKGYAGTVTVNVTFAADGTIESVGIDENDFSDGKSFGAAALDKAYLEQFVGQKAPLKVDAVDAASFATVTHQAVIEAINAAYEGK